MTRRVVALVIVSICAAGTDCTGSIGAANGGFAAPRTVDPTASIPGISGIGMESQDFIAMTDKMVRDLLATPRFANAATPPRVIIDDTRFRNESDQMLNLALIVDRLRIALMRAAHGKILFVSRRNLDLVEAEKKLKTSGQVDAGSSVPSQAVAGADYVLIGKIASQETTNIKSGVRANYYQLTFEMLDLNNDLSVWGNLYDVKKAGADDEIYR